MDGSDIHTVFSSVPQGELHHAYCVVGDADAAVSEITRFLESAFGLRAAGNPDFWVRNCETFGIDDAHALKEASERRALVERKIFIISTLILTNEAQNALLKTIEEPSPETHFFFVLPTEEILFPTLRSRLHLVRLRGGRFSSPSPADASLFLKSELPKRLSLLKPLLALEEEKKRAAEAFTGSLEKKFRAAKNGAAFSRADADADALAELLRVRRYLYDRSPSFKILLEHLALIIPQMK